MFLDVPIVEEKRQMGPASIFNQVKHTVEASAGSVNEAVV
jgi:hypothetical protein